MCNEPKGIRLSELDSDVGRISGAIYTDIADSIPGQPLMLVPSLSYKVRRRLEKLPPLRQLSRQQKVDLAGEIQAAVLPLLFSLDIDPQTVAEISPAIHRAALNAMDHVPDVR